MWRPFGEIDVAVVSTSQFLFRNFLPGFEVSFYLKLSVYLSVVMQSLFRFRFCSLLPISAFHNLALSFSSLRRLSSTHTATMMDSDVPVVRIQPIQHFTDYAISTSCSV